MAVSSADIKKGLVACALVSLIILYKLYNPAESAFFPKCPFRMLSGLQCPGCGSQRAIHHILIGEIGEAFAENFLLVLAVPYIFIGFAIDLVKEPRKSLASIRKTFYGRNAAWVILGVVCCFWVLRNLVGF